MYLIFCMKIYIGCDFMYDFVFSAACFLVSFCWHSSDGKPARSEHDNWWSSMVYRPDNSRSLLCFTIDNNGNFFHHNRSRLTLIFSINSFKVYLGNFQFCENIKWIYISLTFCHPMAATSFALCRPEISFQNCLTEQLQIYFPICFLNLYGYLQRECFVYCSLELMVFVQQL